MKFLTSFLIYVSLFTCMDAQKIDIYNRPVQQERSRDFDAIHYNVELDVDVENKMLMGKNTITLSPLRNDLGTVILDAVSFVVTDVIDYRGIPLNYSQNDGKLSIHLLRKYSHKDTVTVSVHYYLKEQVKGLRFIEQTKNSPVQVSSDCFPNKARQWIPCYDFPNDKVSHDMIITVDSGYKVLSNGCLKEVIKDEASGKYTWHWSQKKPNATYLFNLSIADYAVIQDSLGALPVNYWVYHSNVEDAKRSFAKTPYMIDFYSRLYDYEFPWAKYDQVISAYMGGGAEATSATLLGEGAVTDEKAEIDFSYEGVIAHEIAHQWWGDLITCRSWEHTWMNESFGTYSDHLYKRYAWGKDEGDYDLLRKKNGYLREAHDSYMRPIVFNRYESPGQNFDSHTYPKGACVLHMLRFILGDETFFRTLSEFLHSHEFQSVSTQDFITCVKEVSGKNMDWFFEQFLFYPGHAVFEISKKWDEASKTLTMQIVQTQDKWDNVPIYKLPVNIGLYTEKNKIVEQVWMNEKSETFSFHLDSKPVMVRFDEGNHLLKEWTFIKSEEELLYQAKNDDMTGRLWAVNELKKFSSSERTIETWSHIAINDSFWAVREAALRNLGESGKNDYKDLFLKATGDESSKVRTAALNILGDFREQSMTGHFRKIFETDESYLVMAEALKSIGKCGGKSQLSYLKEAKKVKSHRDVVKRAAEQAIEMINGK